jgi:hypothetical protein
MTRIGWKRSCGDTTKSGVLRWESSAKLPSDLSVSPNEYATILFHGWPAAWSSDCGYRADELRGQRSETPNEAKET